MVIVFNMLVSISLLSLSLSLFWLHCVTCRILVPQTGIEPDPPGLPGKSQNRFKSMSHCINLKLCDETMILIWCH